MPLHTGTGNWLKAANNKQDFDFRFEARCLRPIVTLFRMVVSVTQYAARKSAFVTKKDRYFMMILRTMVHDIVLKTYLVICKTHHFASRIERQCL